MRLTTRLLLGSLSVVGVLVVLVFTVVDAPVGDVGLVAGVSVTLALALAWLFSRSVVRPVVELRDVTRALADGDLRRRPSLAGPGEVGDLATAVHRLAEQLNSRIEALEGEDVRLNALFDSLNEGVIAIDASQQVVRLNERARELVAVRAEVPFPVSILPRDRGLREAIGDAVDGHAIDAHEIQIGERDVSLTARPLRGGGAVLALFDLTPVRRLEAVRRDFVANVSHELRTPLTVIAGFGETLMDDGLPPEARRKFAATLVAHASRMQRLVDELLDLTRIESGGWRPDPVRTDVHALAADVLASARPRAEAKSLELREEIAPNAGAVFADATAVRHVLSNLVDNALRYTNAGTVTVYSRRTPTGVALGVRDTGPGIAAEHLPRLFERFYRVDTARSRAEGGTGLGLAIVKHLAEAHGGRVGVESTVGRGTIVWAEFPDGPPTPAA